MEANATLAPATTAVPPRPLRPPLPLILLALLTAGLVALPLVYLLIRALQGDAETWGWLFSARLPGLLWNSLLLTVGTTGLGLLISLPLAWLVTRSDLKGRRLIGWLVALPLVIPPYIGAFAYITLFGPRGLIEKSFSITLPSLYSTWGTILVLTLFTYPYIYLLAVSALQGLNQSLEDADRSAGLSPWQVFRRITLPLIRPALGSGLLMVAMYSLSDFGSVSMMRYDTFTSAIYLQLRGRLDRSGAAALSLLLVLLTSGLLWLEARTQKSGARYEQGGGGVVRPVPLGRWRLPAYLFVGAVLGLGLGVPLVMLIFWTGQQATPIHPKLIQYAGNSLLVAGGTALFASLLAFAPAYLVSRRPSPLTKLLYQFSYFGNVLPGVVVALSAIFLFNNYLPGLYGTLWVLFVALIIRYLPQAMGAQRSGLSQVPLSLEEAGRSLGHSSFSTFRRVVLPLIQSSLLSGAALVFLNALKELPASLLLRPAGFETLAVRVWIDAGDGFYEAAAPAALLLLVLTGIPMALLLKKVLAGEARLR